MRVILVEYTKEPEFLGTFAAEVCHTSIDDIDGREDKALLKRILKMGHLSVLEHISFTFLISGISRVTTHQLVRHRMASYSQQSHRYTRIKDKDFICPPSIRNNEKAYNLFKKNVKDNLETYNRLIEMGIKKEDARYIIPQAVTSTIIVTMNARELLHFFKLRCAKNAQWEIREMANEMLRLVKEKAPIIFGEIKDE